MREKLKISYLSFRVINVIASSVYFLDSLLQWWTRYGFLEDIAIVNLHALSASFSIAGWLNHLNFIPHPVNSLLWNIVLIVWCRSPKMKIHFSAIRHKVNQRMGCISVVIAANFIYWKQFQGKWTTNKKGVTHPEWGSIYRPQISGLFSIFLAELFHHMIFDA